ncbi:MAG: hypothetical protein LBH06_08540 [Rikenellaceae bacterium]|jgi:hypothetical protein|nr:hypothetical protein [Rikenellaceae bacterium]
MLFKNIKIRIFRALLNLAAMTHLRHFHGHGIHSPFVYNLVRNTFIKRHIVGHDDALYKKMRQIGLPEKASVQLQNICHYLHFSAFEIVETPETFGRQTAYDSKTLYFVPSGAPVATIGALAGSLDGVGGTLVALYPRHEPARMRFCRKLCRQKRFLSIDNRRFIIMLFDNKLPKQHYRL